MAFRSQSGLIIRRRQGNTLTLPCWRPPFRQAAEGDSERLQFNGISAYRVGSSRESHTLNDVPEVPALILRILGHVYRRRIPRLFAGSPVLRNRAADSGRRS